MPLSDPTATVKSSNNIRITSTIPARATRRTITTNNAGQYAGQVRQIELPRERLKPGLHDPHSKPMRLLAHCALGSFKEFIFMSTLEFDGLQ